MVPLPVRARRDACGPCRRQAAAAPTWTCCARAAGAPRAAAAPGAPPGGPPAPARSGLVRPVSPPKSDGMQTSPVWVSPCHLRPAAAPTGPCCARPANATQRRLRRPLQWARLQLETAAAFAARTLPLVVLERSLYRSKWRWQNIHSHQIASKHPLSVAPRQHHSM